MNAPLLPLDVVAGERARGDVVVFAHGIMGNRNNWKSFAKKLVERVPETTAVLVDLRRHGDAHDPAFVDEDDTVRGAGDDVVRTLRAHGLVPVVFVGHSWGGKCLLAVALERVFAELAHVVVVDAPPGTRTFDGSDEEVIRVVRLVSSLPEGLARDRRHLVEELTARGLSMPLAQWMTTNVVPRVEGPTAEGLSLRWRFEVPAVRRMLADFGALDLWPALLAHRAPPQVHMVRGGRSDRWRAEELQRLAQAVAAGVVVDTVLERAGHWVHTDDPEGLLAIVAPLCRL
jgi:pimeloyl-ACP methyl ester carboxylesterase